MCEFFFGNESNKSCTMGINTGGKKIKRSNSVPYLFCLGSFLDFVSNSVSLVSDLVSKLVSCLVSLVLILDNLDVN